MALVVHTEHEGHPTCYLIIQEAKMLLVLFRTFSQKALYGAQS